MEDKQSILVIGSKGHTLADKCIDWGDDFYVGDYNVIIVSLKNLTSDKINYFKTNKPKYLEDFRAQVVEAQQKGLKIFCILEPLVFSSDIGKHSDEEERKAWNSYSWCPIIPVLEYIRDGKKIDLSSSKLLPDYLKLVKGWSILFKDKVNNTGYVDYKKVENYQEIRTRIFINPLLKNTIGRYISFEVVWKTQRESEGTAYVYSTLAQSSAPLVFLPQVDDNKKAIDVVLVELSEQEKELPPDWVSKIEVGNEKELLSKIEEKQKEITTKKKELASLEEEISQFGEYKKLLYSSGFILEDIVEKSLKTLGITIISPSEKNKEDRLFNKEDASIPIEIRGKNAGLNEKDLNQLTSRFVDKPESLNFKTRGVFILNHFRQIEPEKRDDPFHYNIIEKASPWKVCLITTQTIFDLVKRKFEGEEYADLEKELFNTIGVFKIKPESSLNGEIIKNNTQSNL